METRLPSLPRPSSGRNRAANVGQVQIRHHIAHVRSFEELPPTSVSPQRSYAGDLPPRAQTVLGTAREFQGTSYEHAVELAKIRSVTPEIDDVRRTRDVYKQSLYVVPAHRNRWDGVQPLGPFSGYRDPYIDGSALDFFKTIINEHDDELIRERKKKSRRLPAKPVLPPPEVLPPSVFGRKTKQVKKKALEIEPPKTVSYYARHPEKKRSSCRPLPRPESTCSVADVGLPRGHADESETPSPARPGATPALSHVPSGALSVETSQGELMSTHPRNPVLSSDAAAAPDPATPMLASRHVSTAESSSMLGGVGQNNPEDASPGEGRASSVDKHEEGGHKGDDETLERDNEGYFTALKAAMSFRRQMPTPNIVLVEKDTPSVLMDEGEGNRMVKVKKKKKRETIFTEGHEFDIETTMEEVDGRVYMKSELVSPVDSEAGSVAGSRMGSRVGSRAGSQPGTGRRAKRPNSRGAEPSRLAEALEEVVRGSDDGNSECPPSSRTESSTGHQVGEFYQTNDDGLAVYDDSGSDSGRSYSAASIPTRPGSGVSTSLRGGGGSYAGSEAPSVGSSRKGRLSRGKSVLLSRRSRLSAAKGPLLRAVGSDRVLVKDLMDGSPGSETLPGAIAEVPAEGSPAAHGESVDGSDSECCGGSPGQSEGEQEGRGRETTMASGATLSGSGVSLTSTGHADD
eukprot:Rmarinus@m.12683